MTVSRTAALLACACALACGDDPPAASPDASAPDAGPAIAPDAAAAVLTARLVASEPSNEARNVPRSAWIRLDFDEPVDLETARRSIALECAGASVALAVHRLDAASLLVNPAPELPGGASCRLTAGASSIAWSTAADDGRSIALYDRRDRRRLAPLPDDALSSAGRLAIPVPEGLGARELALYQALIEGTRALDGWSPIAHAVIELSDTASVASLPRTASASLDRLATVGLFDVDPTSPSYGERVPFTLQARDEANAGGTVSRTLLVFPGIPLEPKRRYALAVTRRALSAPGRPIEPDPAFGLAIGPPLPGEAPEIAAVRAAIGPAIAALERDVSPPIPPEDLALVVRFTVRSVDAIPLDPLAMRQRVIREVPPPLTITSTEADGDGSGPIAMVVRGSFTSPRWRNGDNLARDASGMVAPTGTVAHDFVLALPRASRPAPLILFQHGNPGSAESVVGVARQGLAEAGFAVIGFTDVLNREVSPGAADPAEAGRTQVLATLQALLRSRRLPDYWLDTTGQQLALIAALPGTTIDLAPPDGQNDIDGTTLLYFGISEGAVRGSALLPYAPELRAAALTVGGARLVETLIHQAGPRFIGELGVLIPDLTPAEIWVGLAMFQMLFDDQDGHVHARFYGRQRVGPTAGERASVLMTAGLDDGFIPNAATESLAWQMGLPQLLPAARRVPFLAPIEGPVRANLDPGTSGAFFQWVPAGVADRPPTPGCEAQPEGHYCPQGAPPAVAQRLRFFSTALDGPAEIAGP